MIFQNPMTSLNPVWPIGGQITEGLRVHGRIAAGRRANAASSCCAGSVSPAPRSVTTSIPFQWSGGHAAAGRDRHGRGEASRSCSSPTSRRPRRRHHPGPNPGAASRAPARSGMTIVLVSHDMAVVAETCDRVAVMYAWPDRRGRPDPGVIRSTAASLHPRAAVPPRQLGDRAGVYSRSPASLPDLAGLPPGCPFAERRRFASTAGPSPVRPASTAGTGGQGRESACFYHRANWPVSTHRIYEPAGGS